MYARLIDNTELDWKRSLYKDFSLGRLTGLVGPRGVGKTTLMLQYIKEHLYDSNKAFYFAADNVYFNQTSLLEFVNELYLTEGYRYFFIDEIHKYHNWNQELKNLYDGFPDIKIAFSGSSMLDIVSGSYDLSRRVNMYHMPGMSFREYLSFSLTKELETIEFKTLIDNPSKYSDIGLIEKLKGHFQDYLQKGYYPFVFEDEETYCERMLRMINKVIYEDISNYYNLKTQNLHLFKKILSFLASIPPGEINTNNIAKNLGVAHQTITNFLTILENVGLIQLVYPFDGGNQLLRNPQKIFLHNTNLLYVLEKTIGEPVNKGSLRELYFIQALRDADINVFYSKQADYRTEDLLFEIGGKNKTRRQLVDSELHRLLIKDDILIPSKDVIPLCYLGFLY